MPEDRDHGVGSVETVELRALAELLVADRHISASDLHRVAPGVDEMTRQLLITLRGQLDRLRARDRELSALVSTTRELVEVRDVQPLLQKLVDRAHDLMGTDVTYLSEYDEETDELFVRATRGAVSPNIRELRVPAGVGLASEVVRTRSAQWTSAYESASFPQDDEVSAAVEAEHLKSILGVPLISSDRVLGALFAADRSAHGFSADQIALLRAFADQGAVILQSARLLAAARDAAERASAATAEAEHRALAMEAAAQLHEQLTGLVLAGEGPAAMAQTVASSLGRSVAIADRDLECLATSDELAAAWWHDGNLLPPLRSAIEESRKTARCVRVTRSRGGAVGVVAAMAGQMLLGALLVGDPDLDEVEQRTIERSAQIHALVTMQRDAVADAEERVRGELLGDLVTGRGDRATLRRRAAQRGIDLDAAWTPVVVSGWSQERWSVARSLAALDPDWLVAQHQGEVLALVPGDEEVAQIARRVYGRLAARSDSGLVIVGSPRQTEEVAEEVDGVLTLSRLLPGLGVTEGAISSTEFAPYVALFGPNGERARQFALSALGPVITWDADHQTALTETLDAYLGHNASVTRAAAALFVHPNTVKQRLARIDELLGSDWRSPERQFRVTVALNILRVSKQNT
jgi:hypothetical protein